MNDKLKTLALTEDGRVITNQRTLIVILGAVAAAALAYADLKGDVKTHTKALEELRVTTAADHDAITKIQSGIDYLVRARERGTTTTVTSRVESEPYPAK